MITRDDYLAAVIRSALACAADPAALLSGKPPMASAGPVEGEPGWHLQ